jgi:hypothetical protein
VETTKDWIEAAPENFTSCRSSITSTSLPPEVDLVNSESHLDSSVNPTYMRYRSTSASAIPFTALAHKSAGGECVWTRYRHLPPKVSIAATPLYEPPIFQVEIGEYSTALENCRWASGAIAPGDIPRILAPDATLIVSEGHDRDWVSNSPITISKHSIQATSAGTGGWEKREKAVREWRILAGMKQSPLEKMRAAMWL